MIEAKRLPDDELDRIRHWLAHFPITVGTETPEGIPLAQALLGHVEALLADDRLERAEAILRRLTAPRRTDGTYNIGREAAEQMANDYFAKGS